MKLGLLLYLPPPRVPNTQLFFDHFRRYKVSTDLILYSDHPWPGALMLKGDPEQYRHAQFPDGTKNKFGVANASFFTGLRIAWLEGYTHVILVEPDVRVGCDFWDVAIWQEYFSLGFPAIAAGTLACYNPCNHSPAATRKWEALVAMNAKKNFPIATYGWLGGGVRGPSCVFPNGALAVYDIGWMAKLFDLQSTGAFIAHTTAWDMAIGVEIWKRFEYLSFDVVGHLNCIYSGYGDIVSTEQERRELLLSEKVVAVHQIKSVWAP